MSDSPIKSPRRKSQRRSSFAASRINILHKGTSGQVLYKDIDVDKFPEPEDRLIMLTKACLEYTLQKMKEEMCGCRDYDTYKREVEESALRKIADMEVNGMFKEATQKERTLPNPINTEMDCAIEDLKAKISRLKEESSNWDALITDTETKIAEYEQSSQTKTLTELDVPDNIKAKSDPYLSNRLDYSSLLTDLDHNCKKICLMMHEHAQVIGKLNTVFHHDLSAIQKHIDNISELQKPADTPRKVIQSLLSFPTPNK